jgi:hypothetical protein
MVAKLDQVPFNEAYREFGTELKRCSDLFAIGVGFGDRDLARDIVGWLGEKEGRRLIVIDKFLTTRTVIERLSKYARRDDSLDKKVFCVTRDIEDATCMDEIKALAG